MASLPIILKYILTGFGAIPRVYKEAVFMRKRILVVDDDAMNLKRTQMILEKSYNILLAESGREALEKLKF